MIEITKEKIVEKIQEKENQNNKWLEGLEKEGLLYLYLVSLISADSLLTVEDCEESLREIENCLEILPENDIKDREKIRNMLLDGKVIVLKDMENLKNGKTDN